MTFTDSPSVVGGRGFEQSDNMKVLRTRRRVQQPGGWNNLWFKKCQDRVMVQYLQTSNCRVGCVGEALLRQVIRSALVTRDPVRQETLVTGPVSDGVGCGTRQAEQNCVIGQTDVSQTESHPLPVEVPGSGFLAVVWLAGERPGSRRREVLCYVMQYSTYLHQAPNIRDFYTCYSCAIHGTEKLVLPRNPHQSGLPWPQVSVSLMVCILKATVKTPLVQTSLTPPCATIQ